MTDHAQTQNAIKIIFIRLNDIYVEFWISVFYKHISKFSSLLQVIHCHFVILSFCHFVILSFCPFCHFCPNSKVVLTDCLIDQG